MQRFWNAREPGQRTWVGIGEQCEPPVEDGGHVVCGSEVAWGQATQGGAAAAPMASAPHKVALIDILPTLHIWENTSRKWALDSWHWSMMPLDNGLPELMMGAIAQKLKAQGVKTVGYIGYTDTWGDIVYKAIQSQAAAGGFKIVTDERYARSDTSVTGQILRLDGGSALGG